MTEIALDCGYPASSLKERIYALGAQSGCDRCGVLIYTASAGAQGTLGGLIATAPRFASMLKRVHWSACSSAQTIPCAPITSRTGKAAIEPLTAPPAMAAS